MKIFIGSGSNPLIGEKYLEETRIICQKLCDLDCSLVFGSYSKGMMGESYKTFVNSNKKVLGLSLNAYKEDLINLPNMEVIEMDTSFKRLEYVFNESDIFLILPGGTGTISELFGLLEEFKTTKLNKKLIIYNYKGFYNELFDFIKNLEQRGFAYGTELDKVVIVNNINELEGEILNERD